MRKTKTVTIPAGSRDAGKAFLLTEMPADEGEAWGIRAMGAMMRSGIPVPEEIDIDLDDEIGMAGIAIFGLKALLAAPYEESRPLFDEMMGCVKIIEPAIPEGRALLPSDIEEIGTRMRLRDEVIALHLNFSPIAALWTAAKMAKMARGISSTKTSPDESAPLSPPA